MDLFTRLKSVCIEQTLIELSIQSAEPELTFELGAVNGFWGLNTPPDEPLDPSALNGEIAVSKTNYH